MNGFCGTGDIKMTISNFTFKELIHTDTANDNVPNDLNIIKNLVRLAEFLQTIRNELHLHIIVNSAYRSESVNKAVGRCFFFLPYERACC